jgi:aspartokinase
MFAALAGPQIRVLMVNTSEVHITIAVELSRAKDAVTCLRSTFGLNG